MKQILLTTLAFVICCSAILSCKKDDETDENPCPTIGFIQYKSGTTSFILPNAFTPNDDAMNDHFRVLYINLDTTNFELTILGGNKGVVFHTKSVSTGWDGKLPNGQKASTGIYNVNVRFNKNDGAIIDTCNTVALLQYDSRTGCIPAGAHKYYFEDEWDTNSYHPGTGEKICP